ncbi:MAG: sigma-54-dependent Fis family transcriptional regulator [Planctomycetes bacterium]|nr:sigma-54-dependent Fis family transcriptional regulator [Planctomycetota bacterium]
MPADKTGIFNCDQYNMKNLSILIVDSDSENSHAFAGELRGKFGDVSVVCNGEEAMQFLAGSEVDVVITEMELGGAGNGLDVLRFARSRNLSVSVVFVVGNGSIENCKQAIKGGALDYLEKPVSVERIEAVISAGNVGRGKGDKDKFVFNGIVGRSHAMQGVFHVLRKVAPTNIGVLIEGESGSGKELIARAIHDNSHRKDKPFVPMNCAGLTESLLESELFGHSKGAFTGAISDRKGLFENADKGTLFLDEIGDMPLNMQAKLLRVLEDGVLVPVGSTKPTVVDVRVVSATNCDLAELVKERMFRQDLYFRIKGVSITVPPLRNRPGDIAELFGFFLKEICLELGKDIRRITEGAMSILQGYEWPGNIRQLRNCIRVMVVMCDGDMLDIRDVPPEINRVKQIEGHVSGFRGEVVGVQLPGDYTGLPLGEVEKLHIKNTLEATGGNRAEASKILKIGERTLYRKIKEYDL